MRKQPGRRADGARTLGPLFAMIVFVAAVLPVAAQEAGRKTFYDRARVTAVELVVTVEDATGAVPADLEPIDFEILEDGKPVPVVGVEVWNAGTFVGNQPSVELPKRSGPVAIPSPPPATWHTVIFFDQVLSSSRSIRRAAEGLAAQARRLTELGSVEIVTAHPWPERLLAPTRSSPLVEQTLTRIARETVGRDQVRRLRKQFLDRLLLKGELDGSGAGSFTQRGGVTFPPEALASLVAQGRDPRRAQENRRPTRSLQDGALFTRRDLVRTAQLEEIGLLRRQHDALLGWVGQYSGRGPRALILVNDGFDLDPRTFYSEGATPAGGFSSMPYWDSEGYGAGSYTEWLAKTLAVRGWVTLGIAGGALESGLTFGAEVTGRGRLGDLMVGRENSTSEFPSDLFTARLAPLNKMAAYTGGSTLTGVVKLPAALARLRDKVRLTYQVERPPDGLVRRLEVRTLRPGLKVEAPRWSGSEAPEEVSAARARRLLAGGGDRGGVPVVAAIALEPPAAEPEAAGRRGKLQARVDLRSIKDSLTGAALTPVRVTVAASFASEDGKAREPFVRHDLIDSQSLAGLDAWTYGLPLSVPGEVERVAVVFEELVSGVWGGSLAASIEGQLPAAVLAQGASDHDSVPGAIPEDLLPERKPILLLPFEESIVRGRLLVDPVVANPSVVKVEYWVDGALAEESVKPPFATKVDFGPLPSPHLIEAVALSVDGREVGRDALSVNEGVGAFRVRLIEPRAGERIGVVDVEAEVKVPGGLEELDRVEFYWSGEKVATLFEPPFRSRVFVPAETPTGYVGAVAHRSDGTSTEDVVFLNGAGSSDRVDVELIELFTVVGGPEDRPVRGLEQAEFRVLEDGLAQPIADFRAGAEMPLSLGLLMDTSASMTPVMRASQTAAIDFLLLTLREQDRAMVVGFDARPRLEQALTGSKDDLVQAIAALRPGGTSALCDALVFSLVQMQRVPGRRALVVLTDGVGREERVDFGTCQRFVQRSGVPTYAILLAGDDPTAARQGGVDREKLGRLVELVGGRLFVADSAESLGRVYRSVIEELRSQYLLTYYPQRGLAATGSDDWRDVEVDVGRPGLVARTIAGYYP